MGKKLKRYNFPRSLKSELIVKYWYVKEVFMWCNSEIVKNVYTFTITLSSTSFFLNLLDCT